jgi:hypothetical protein
MPRKEGAKAKVGRKPPRHAAHTPEIVGHHRRSSPAASGSMKRWRIVSKAIRSRLSPNK